MNKYISFFKLRVCVNLQYRTAALAGIATQFSWGIMNIFVFIALYNTDASAFPMTMQATSTYIWLQQVFLPLFKFWFVEDEVFESISNGNLSYELCRPINLYNLWFARNLANRLSKTFLRCSPVLIVSLLLPFPYGMTVPSNLFTFIMFFISMIFATIISVSLCMMAYILTFYTLSPIGVKSLFVSIVELFSGAIIPLPFFPEYLKNIIKYLPFASMQDVPFRIYTNDITGDCILSSIALQIFWATVLLLLGKYLCNRSIKKIVLQGG